MESVQAKCHNYVKRLSKAYPIQSKPNEAPGMNSTNTHTHQQSHSKTHTSALEGVAVNTLMYA